MPATVEPSVEPPPDEPRTESATFLSVSPSNGHSNEADFAIFGRTVICVRHGGQQRANERGAGREVTHAEDPDAEVDLVVDRQIACRGRRHEPALFDDL